MTNHDLERAARDIEQLSGVIEIAVWSDSISVRYSGTTLELRRRARKHDLYPCNIDGIVYFEPVTVQNPEGELVPLEKPEAASVVETAESVQAAHIIEEDDEKRLLVATTGVENVHRFSEIGGYGWQLSETKEAQIRFTPPVHGVSYLSSRDTDQLRQLERVRESTN
jgi:hypothetical protein